VTESQFPLIKGREVILFVGRINWVKNLDLLLKALVRVRHQRPNAMLMLVGPTMKVTGWTWRSRRMDSEWTITFSSLECCRGMR